LKKRSKKLLLLWAEAGQAPIDHVLAIPGVRPGGADTVTEAGVWLHERNAIDRCVAAHALGAARQPRAVDGCAGGTI
jgi:hypothetical protein